MICGNCNKEIPYDTQTVANHLDGRCSGFVKVSLVPYVYGFLNEILDHDLIDHDSFRQAEVYRNTTQVDIYTKNPIVPWHFLNDLLNTSNIGCLILKDGKICLKLK